MEIFDRDGKAIGYVNPSDIKPHPLSETRQTGERKREDWLKDLARRSSSENWSLQKADYIVRKEVEQFSNLTPSSHSALVSEGKLVTKPDVRTEFFRLSLLRDQCWDVDRSFLKGVKHGPQQLLVDILRRQSKLSERRYVISPEAYLAFMRERYSK